MPRSRRPTVDPASTPAARGRPRKEREIVNYDQPTFLKHYDDITEKLRLKASADSALSTAYKAAERAGVDRKDLKRARGESEKTADERQRDADKLRQHMEWLGKPLGHQAGMDLAPQEPTPNGHDEHPGLAVAVEKHQNTEAFESGVSAGKAGSALAACPFEPGSEQYQSYSSGWSEGQRLAIESLGGATRTARISEAGA